MALRRIVLKRIYGRTIKDQSPLIGTLHDSTFISPSAQTPENYFSSISDAGFFRRFLQRNKINQSSTILNLPELFYFPIGEKLKIAGSVSFTMDGLRHPTTKRTLDPVDSVGISVKEARKIMRCSEMQKVRSSLKRINSESVTYSEFMKICSGACTNRDRGVTFAKILDEAGDVIVLGNVVFLRPHQVAKSMEKLISQALDNPNETRKHELEEFEKKKTVIDQKATSQVHGELYCGLGLMVVEMLVFMRLTFWELSWDVLEPICFFVTSLHFAFAYMFFLKTSNEPTFVSYFQCRFKVKQMKLMEVYNFDHQKYNELCNAFYPNNQNKHSGVMDLHVGGSDMVFGKF